MADYSRAIWDATAMKDVARLQQYCVPGVNVEFSNSGWSPLMLAVQNNTIDCAIVLLNSGANPNVRGTVQQTPLHMVAFSGADQMMNLLLQRGAVPNVVASDGNAPLHLAVQYGHVNCVQLLLNAGADKAASRADGKTALDIALMTGNPAVIALLQQQAQPVAIPVPAPAPIPVSGLSEAVTSLTIGDDNLLTAAQRGDLARVKQLIASGADVESRSENGWSPLLLAIERGHAIVVDELLKYPATNVNLRSGKRQTPALGLAAFISRPDILGMLLRHAHIQISQPAADGSTALHTAVEKGDVVCVQLLLQAGANMNIARLDGVTPLQLAMNLGYHHLVSLMTGQPTAGAAPAQPTSDGRRDSNPGVQTTQTCGLAGCTRPCARDGGKVFEFCGRAHGQEFKQQQTAKVDQFGKCMHRGCDKPRHVKPSGDVDDYCCRQHESQSQQDPEPHVVVLKPSEKKFQDIKAQFEAKWTKTAYGHPSVVSIAQLQMASPIRQAYTTYRKSLIERQPAIKVFGAGGPGNEQRRFHGTGIKCQLGMPGNNTLCSRTDCAVCGISRTNFRLSKAFAKTGWGRFGRGLYFTSTSSKSHDYNKDSEIGLGANRRCTIMVQVMIGRGCELTQDDQSLTVAPSGYDSVLGQVGGGGALNYDELVVYSEDHVIPKYLIIYDIA
eukprot:TRINITY_DN752_c0_g1_i1.p1 TRINITY_DN752_c0_g1~~TRINITY_DN752_c0_g1_i1.p1  ORF type:complete len:683 (+),score=104.00 TRINITY_DN752_c0_g1_i1:44-2050(+)